MGIMISYFIGFICIVFPKKSTGVIQKIIDHLLKIQVERMNTPVSEEDKTIGPITSVLIGIVIVGITAFVHSQGTT